MRAIVQRVKSAALSIEGQEYSRIGRGLVVYVGIGPDDDEAAFSYMLDKITNLRIFEDAQEKLNLSVRDIGGEILWVSNFTLYGDCRHGRRPSFSASAGVEDARKLYARFTEMAGSCGVASAFGVFQANMQIEQICDGPVNLMLDSGKLF